MTFENSFGYNVKIPDSFQEIFMWLCQDVVMLQSKWIFYLDLFSNPKSASLLSKLASASFQIIEEALRMDMTMSICRLSAL